MAESTLPNALEGRNLVEQQVTFIRKDITAKDPVDVKIGVLPRGAVILSVKCYVKEIFTDTKLKIGSTLGGSEFGEKEIKTKSIQDYTPSDSKLFVGMDSELVLYSKRDKETDAGECSVVVTFVANR